MDDKSISDKSIDENLTKEQTSHKEKSIWRKKAISLNTAIIMTISGGSVLTGCSFKTYEEKVKDQEEEEEYTYHGNGVTPFIFNSGKSSSSYSKFSSGGWKSWTSSSSSGKTAIHQGSSYSSSHSTGFSA